MVANDGIRYRREVPRFRRATTPAALSSQPTRCAPWALPRPITPTWDDRLSNPASWISDQVPTWQPRWSSGLRKKGRTTPATVQWIHTNFQHGYRSHAGRSPERQEWPSAGIQSRGSPAQLLHVYRAPPLSFLKLTSNKRFAYFWPPSTFTNTDHCLLSTRPFSNASSASICLGWSTKRRTIAPLLATSPHRSDRSLILFIGMGSPYRICFSS